jgi:hypothetical protein
MQRTTIPEIWNHSWFLKNLPADLMDDDSTAIANHRSDHAAFNRGHHTTYLYEMNSMCLYFPIQLALKI